MKLTCKCGNAWDYTGKKKKYATCPDCRKLVKIGQDKTTGSCRKCSG